MDLYVQAKEFNQDQIAENILNIKDDNVKYLSCVHILKEDNKYIATTIRIVLPCIMSPIISISEVFPKELEYENETFSFTNEYFFIDELQGWVGVYNIKTSCSTNNSKSLMMLVEGSQSFPKHFDSETYYALFGSKKSKSESKVTLKDSSSIEEVI